MATPAQRTNTWTLNEWYDQAVAGTQGTYVGSTQLWTWGSGNEGRIANNLNENRSSPIQIAGTTWSALSTCIGASSNSNSTNGKQTMLGLKSDGTAWGWGRNESGEIPVNDNESYSSVKQIPGSWSALSCAYMGGLGIKTDGTLWGWGRANYGQLGQGNPVPSQPYRSSPVQIGTSSAWKDIASGAVQDTHAIKTDGTLWGTGRNIRGCLMLNTSGVRATLGESPFGNTWSHFGEAGGLIDCFAAFKTDGSLWVGGSASYGRLGLNAPGANLSSPVQLPGNWSNICMAESALATKTDGTLWGWGDNQNGSLGLNNRTNYSSPVQIPGSWQSSTIFTNSRMSGAAKTDGTMWVWGKNQSGGWGQNGGLAGNPEGPRRSSPVQIPGTDWIGKDVSFSYNTIAFLKEF